MGEAAVKEYRTSSPEETFLLAKELAKDAHPGSLYALDGDLGAGKTVFAQGFAEGLGIEEAVNSPTFTILQIYDSGRLPLFHFDLYRLESEEELMEIGAEEYLCGAGVSLVEWASLFPDILPKPYHQVRIERLTDEGWDERRIVIREVLA